MPYPPAHIFEPVVTFQGVPHRHHLKTAKPDGSSMTVPIEEDVNDRDISKI
jgi:hypothetical protein